MKPPANTIATPSSAVAPSLLDETMLSSMIASPRPMRKRPPLVSRARRGSSFMRGPYRSVEWATAALGLVSRPPQRLAYTGKRQTGEGQRQQHAETRDYAVRPHADGLPCFVSAVQLSGESQGPSTAHT